MPARNKKPSAPASEKRHDNGLIAPGKKVVKDKQPLQPNGNAGHRQSQPASASAVAVDDNIPRPNNSSSEDDADDRGEYSAMAKSVENGTAAPRRKGSDGSSVAAGDADDIADSSGHDDPAAAGTTSASTANGSISSKQDTNSSPFADAVTTVIGPHSHWDVLAILLLLLQLPPLMLVIVQSSFAFMTFGNTANNWSMFSLSSAQDWFRSHGGNPSAVVSLLADICFTCVWLLSPIMKDFVLDLAPAVVALSLGGGTAAKDSWKHAAICMTTVFFGHIFHERERRQSCLNLIWTGMSKLSLSHLSFAPTVQDILPTSHRSARSWARIVLELHIVTHGFVRVIRRWIDRSSQSAGAKANTRPEQESAATSQPVAPSSGEVALEGGRNASTDGRPPGQPPANRDRTLSSGKKRRKQATLVRSQQPFWAAIATTKIQVSKEIEQSHAERDNFEADATNAQKLGDGKAKCLDDRVWITRVDDTEIWFTATLLKDEEEGAHEQADRSASPSRRGSQEPAMIDVHVNGAYWSSVDSQQSSKSNPGEGGQYDKCEIEGKIFGLTASTNYLVEFVKLSGHKIIYSSSLLTRPVDSSGQLAGIPPQSQESLRPSSPISTLKKSIEAAESKMTDNRNRSNKARKGRQNTTRALKQEVSDLSRLVSSCGTNERQHQRQLQYRQNIKQAEESAVELSAQIADLGEIPSSDKEAFDTSKAKWSQAARARDSLKKELDASKRDGQRKSNDAHSDNAKVRAKREKAEGRLASLMERHKATTEENDAKRNAKAQSEAQHAYKIEHYRNVERSLIRDVQMWDGQRQDFDARAAQMEQQKYFLDGVFPQPLNGQHPVPQTPESSNVGLVSGIRSTAPPINPFVQHSYPIGTPANNAPHRQNSSRQRTRARSSSMLSNISGFTDEEATPHAADYAVAAQNITRNGSGSPRESGFPASSSPMKLSPIGAELGWGSPRTANR